MVLLLLLSTSSIKAGLGIIEWANSSILSEKTLLLEINLGDKIDINICTLVDYYLLQNILPKKPTLKGVITEVIGKAVIVVVIDSTLPLAFSFLPEMPNCFRPTLSDLIRIKRRGQLAEIYLPKLRWTPTLYNFSTKSSRLV